MPSTLKAQGLNHWTASEVPRYYSFGISTNIWNDQLFPLAFFFIYCFLSLKLRLWISSPPKLFSLQPLTRLNVISPSSEHLCCSVFAFSVLPLSNS